MGISKYKKILLCGGVVVFSMIGLTFGVRELLLDGVEELPARPCHGAVKRETVAEILPNSREVSERSEKGVPGDDFRFTCSIRASGGGTLVVEAEYHDSSVKSWRDYYISSQGEALVKAAGDIKILSWDDGASVYFPCVPLGSDVSKPEQAHSMIVRAEVLDDSKISGSKLRRLIADFAFQAAEHSYREAGCRDRIEFPSGASRVIS